MSDRTRVYVADNGLVKSRDGINIRMTGVVTASHPAVAKYPGELRAVGTVDAVSAARIEMLGDAATIARVLEWITPLDAEPVEGNDRGAAVLAGREAARQEFARLDRMVRLPEPPIPVLQDAKAKPGPGSITSEAEVARTRRELRQAGSPSGERSIAKALGVSRDAVRYALGKDRKR